MVYYRFHLSVAYTSGFKFNWAEYYREWRQSLSLMELPSYSFDLKSHWLEPNKGTMVMKSPPRTNPRPQTTVSEQPTSVVRLPSSK